MYHRRKVDHLMDENGKGIEVPVSASAGTNGPLIDSTEAAPAPAGPENNELHDAPEPALAPAGVEMLPPSAWVPDAKFYSWPCPWGLSVSA